LADLGYDRLNRPMIQTHIALAMSVNPEIGFDGWGAAAFRVCALGGNACDMILLVDLIEFDNAGKGQGHGPKPHVDLSLVRIGAHYLAELGARHAGRDALDVEENLPGLCRRQRHLE
jgi:hypothetical protein